MTQKELQILTKAVALAKQNGYDISDDFFTSMEVEDSLLSEDKSYYKIIFDHEFSRCFWGEDLIELGLSDSKDDPKEVDLVQTAEDGNFPIAGLAANSKTIHLPLWQYHMGQMVYREFPIEYIEMALYGALDEEDEPMA
jgi:hypothetical protein